MTNSTAKFTPGPWSYWPMCCRIGGMVTTDAIGMHVCAPTFFEKDPTVTEANANLIAAAPDMCGALKAAEIMVRIMLECWGDTHTNDNGKFRAITGSGTLKEIRAALAKAEGEVPNG